MIVRFRLRRDTAANWTAQNPVLGLGEPGLETDTRRVKYGDGATPWTSLSYSSVGPVAWADITGKPTTLAGYGLTVSNADWSGADLAIVNGGTGASSAAVALSNLGGAPLVSPVFSTSFGFGVTPTSSEVHLKGSRVNGVESQVLFEFAKNPANGATVSFRRAASSQQLLMSFETVSGSTPDGYIGAQAGATSRIVVFPGNGNGPWFGYDFTQGWILGNQNFAAIYASVSPAGAAKFARLNLSGLPTYASDAAAGNAGLVAGDLYKTSDGASGFYLKIKA